MKLTKILNLFKIEPVIWYDFTIKQDYDLTKHPDVSANSPIKNFSVTKKYKYCPDKKILKHQSMTGDWYKKSTYTLAIKEEMDKIDFIHNREKKINKILK